MPFVDYDVLSLFDGICDETRRLKSVSGLMTNDDKWIISSSGQHMFVSFVIDIAISNTYMNAFPGFSMKIHFGNKMI